MAYAPIYVQDLFQGVLSNGSSIPPDPNNTDYAAFLAWLSGEGKTLEQWLAENPPPQPTLGQARVIRLTEIKAQIDNEIITHYPTLDLISLNALYAASVASGFLNRAAYLQQLMDWGQQPYQMFYTARAAVLAATTVEEVWAVTIDETSWQAWVAADPHVTYEEAMASTD